MTSVLAAMLLGAWELRWILATLILAAVLSTIAADHLDRTDHHDD